MAHFKLAHIREQGVDLIIVPLDRSFGWKSTTEQNQIASQLQLRAASAGLAGTVVPVWDHGGGRMGFLAPNGYAPFFRSISLSFVARNINRELSW
jgi:hypothetical protein